MFGIELTALAAVTVAFVFGGFAKGATGIGLPVVAIAIMANVLEPRLALASLIMPALATNVWQAARSEDFFRPLKRFWPMVVCFLATLLIFARVMAKLDTGVLFAILGGVLVLFSVLNLWRPHTPPLTARTQRWAGPVAGLLGGTLGGLTSIWGPPMIMYLVMLRLDKDEWVRTVGFIWGMGVIPLTYAYWQNGVLNPDSLPLSLYACVPALAGTMIGEAARNRINQELFRKALVGFLLIIGFNLIRRGLM